MEELKLPEGSRWTILRRAEDYVYPKSGYHSVRYECRCTCGTVKIVHAAHIKNGSSKSCGCLKDGTSYTGTRTYAAWYNMKIRVKSKADNNKKYEGIAVCDRWLESFKNFLDDLGPCPEGMELERKDVTLGYCPENCCWASEVRQAQNRGKFSNNTSGFTGVAWSKDHNKWRVYLHRNKKKIEGGLHSTIESAIAKRRELEQLYPMEEV